MLFKVKELVKVETPAKLVALQRHCRVSPPMGLTPQGEQTGFHPQVTPFGVRPSLCKCHPSGQEGNNPFSLEE